MNITKGPCPELVRLCRRVPTWISTGIRGAEGDGTGAGDGTGGANGTGTGDHETPREKALREEKDRHYAKAKDAQEKATKAEADLAEVTLRLKAIEDKDKSEAEKAKSDAETALKAKEEADAALAEARQQNDKLQIQIAFLASDKYTWHDAGTALKLVSDFGEVEVKDGEVKGLDKAIDKMAKEKPFLVKTGGTGAAGTGAGGTGQQPNGASTRGTGQDGVLNNDQRTQLASKYNIPR